MQVPMCKKTARTLVLNVVAWAYFLSTRESRPVSDSTRYLRDNNRIPKEIHSVIFRNKAVIRYTHRVHRGLRFDFRVGRQFCIVGSSCLVS